MTTSRTGGNNSPSTSFWLRRKMRATSSSAGVMPLSTSTNIRTASASWIAISAWVRISLMNSLEPIESGSRPVPIFTSVGSIPPVSTTIKSTPPQSACECNRSRVVPGVSSTTANRSPASRLNKVLFPTLGRPTRATTGIRFAIFLSSSRCRGHKWSPGWSGFWAAIIDGDDHLNRIRINRFNPHLVQKNI